MVLHAAAARFVEKDCSEEISLKIKEKLSGSYVKELKNFDRKTTMWIVRNSRYQILSVLLLAVIYGVMAYTGVFMAQLARGIVDSAAYDHDFNKVILFGAALLAVTVLQILLSIASRVTSFNASTKLDDPCRTSPSHNLLPAAFPRCKNPRLYRA